ncbi:MAG: UMP kinase [Spirochaetaceae bacterium]|jgi:uridylate kinase|nr:UMP kinase [Spirochaetaceae bacterium]
MNPVEVFDLGGSIVAQQKMDIDFLKKMKSFVESWLMEDETRRLIIVIGGGYPARVFQNTCRELMPQIQGDELDWIGIMATRLNAQLVKALFGDLCKDDVVTDPSEVKSMKGRILVGAGWKPGFSTDYDAVILAENFGAKRLLNLSNIQKVYTADPKKDPQAKPLDQISWEDYRAMTGDSWTPGMNAPFDPVASKRAHEAGLQVIVAEGRDLNNLDLILKNKNYVGTLIS